MARNVTIAAVQLPASSEGETNTEKCEHNFRVAETWLDQAGEQGADIACIGETFNIIGLKLTPENTRNAIHGVREEALDRFGALARRHNMNLVIPILTVIDGLVRNIAMVLDRQGKYIGHYTKVHCIENEKALGVIPGDEWPVFDLDFGRIGIQICHDNSFPESARCLTLNGAEVVFWPHVMSGWGGEFMDILMRSPSVHNGIYHVPACYGCDLGHSWMPGMLIGRSSVIAPDGLTVADTGRFIGVALAAIDLDLPRVAQQFTRPGDWVWGVDMRNDRRPETYGVLTAPHERTEPIPASALIESPKEVIS